MKRFPLRWMVCLAITAFALQATAQDADRPGTITPSKYLVLSAVGQYGRLPLHRDAVEAQLVDGTWKNPSVGDTVTAPDGRQATWQTAAADGGTLDTTRLRGGYAFATFDAPADAVMILEASGHAAVYVNGELRTGDPYRLGWLRLPVRVAKGTNTLLFHLAAKQLTARLTAPTGDIYFAADDHTLPTIVRGETETLSAAIPIVNATTEWLDAAIVKTQFGEAETQLTGVRAIPPLSVRKVPVVFPAQHDENGDHAHFEVRLMRGDSYSSDQEPPTLAETDITLKIVGVGEAQIRTFVSRIDGSVQPYAVRPADGDAPTHDGTSPGILLTLHGAGVSCEDFAAQYSAKKWAHLVAPQGRRPYGFDWEAWGRIDALEALADAEQHYAHDPARVYLTGQSMGGHGVWHVGATYPDRFAAIGASDGWVSFWSYGGGMPSIDLPTPIEEMMLRGYAPSETVKLLRNLVNTAVFIQHDPGADDVPVEQARFLRQEFAAFHPNFVYYETPAAPAADASPAGPGPDSPRMMEFFQDAGPRLSSQNSFVDFTTADPAISDRCDFVTIDAQLEQLVPSRVEMRFDEQAGAFVGTTSNVARMALDASHLSSGKPVDVTLDEQSFHGLEAPVLWFEHTDGKWSISEPSSAGVKGPKRSGSFSLAFDHVPTLVYGTAGTEEENRWAEAKARYDAETF